MAGPPPPAPWPPSLLTPQRQNRVRGRGEKKWASRYSRPNSEIPIPFPTSVPGYHQPYGNFKAGPYDYGFCPYRYGQGYMGVRPTTLPQYQMRMNGVVQNGGGMDMVQQANAQVSPFGLGRRGTGVFHPSQAQVKCNRAIFNNIKGAANKQGGNHEASYEKCRNKNVSKGKNGGQEGSSQNGRNNKKSSKGKNDGSMKVKKKEEESHDPSLPPGIVLPMEWTY